MHRTSNVITMGEVISAIESFENSDEYKFKGTIGWGHTHITASAGEKGGAFFEHNYSVGRLNTPSSPISARGQFDPRDFNPVLEGYGKHYPSILATPHGYTIYTTMRKEFETVMKWYYPNGAEESILNREKVWKYFDSFKIKVYDYEYGNNVYSED